MMFFVSLIPASMIAAAGYIVLYASGRSEGTIQTVGKVLGVWLFILALLPLAGGAYMALSGNCPMHRGGGMMGSGMMGSGMMGQMGQMGGKMNGAMPGSMEPGAMEPGTMMAPKAPE